MSEDLGVNTASECFPTQGWAGVVVAAERVDVTREGKELLPTRGCHDGLANEMQKCCSDLASSR